MTENLYCLERLSVQKQVEIAAEVRRDHIGKEVVRTSRPATVTFWHRLTSLIPTTLFACGKPSMATDQDAVANVNWGDPAVMSDGQLDQHGTCGKSQAPCESARTVTVTKTARNHTEPQSIRHICVVRLTTLYDARAPSLVPVGHRIDHHP